MLSDSNEQSQKCVENLFTYALNIFIGLVNNGAKQTARGQVTPHSPVISKEIKLMKAILCLPGKIISGSILLKRNFMRAYKEEGRRPKEVLTAALEELERKKIGHVHKFLGRNPVRNTNNFIKTFS